MAFLLILMSRSQYDASSIMGNIVFYALVLFVLQLAFGVFGAVGPPPGRMAGQTSL